MSSPDRHGGGPVVRTRGLTKRYGARTVLDGLDLDVPEGVVAGFIGPNGAGKTTTLRMLLGLVRPTAGQGTVLGMPLSKPAAYLPKVGALVEGPAFYPGLSGQRNLAVLATVAGHDPARIPYVLERVDLAARAKDPYRSYSYGMKQRLGIAAALLGDPRLLVLDEPTNGLDPGGIRDMRELIRSIADGGPTILVSSHLLTELQQIADWLLVIEAGRQVFQGSAVDFLASADTQLVLSCEDPADLPRLLELVCTRGMSASRAGDRLHVCLKPDHVGDRDRLTATLAEINRAAMGEGMTLVELTVVGATLEDRYQAVVTEGVR